LLHYGLISKRSEFGGIGKRAIGRKISHGGRAASPCIGADKCSSESAGTNKKSTAVCQPRWILRVKRLMRRKEFFALVRYYYTIPRLEED
jgi:hypothetical protein